MPSEIFSEDRINNIGEIMPKLSDHVQVGDRIFRGLEGDPMFPYNESTRPEGEVINVTKKSNGLVDLDVKFEDGVHTLSAGNIAGDQVWEFTEDAFRNVLERNIKSTTKSSDVSDSAAGYRGSTNENPEIVKLRTTLDNQINEMREFNQTIVKTLNEMAKDIVSLNPNAKFSSVFANEYRGAIGN